MDAERSFRCKNSLGSAKWTRDKWSVCRYANATTLLQVTMKSSKVWWSVVELELSWPTGQPYLAPLKCYAKWWWWIKLQTKWLIEWGDSMRVCAFTERDKSIELLRKWHQRKRSNKLKRKCSVSNVSIQTNKNSKNLAQPWRTRWRQWCLAFFLFKMNCRSVGILLLIFYPSLAFYRLSSAPVKCSNSSQSEPNLSLRRDSVKWTLFLPTGQRSCTFVKYNNI